jgi:hypothetical protein
VEENVDNARIGDEAEGVGGAEDMVVVEEATAASANHRRVTSRGKSNRELSSLTPSLTRSDLL